MSERAFDPTPYLITLRGKGGGQYLPVAARLIWLRAVHPAAVLETQAVLADDQFAIFRAHVTLPNGASASGHGSESKTGFPDGHIEKAETAAIGRALAALGFGTQFCGDELDEGVRADGRPNIADSPVGGTYTAPATPSVVINDAPQEQTQWLPDGGTHATGDRTPGGATKRTMNYLGALQKEVGLGDDDIHVHIGNQYGKQHRDELSQQEASGVIGWIKTLKDAGVASAPTPQARPAASPSVTEPDPDVSWTGFWRWSRQKGFSNKVGIEQFVGHEISSADPVALRAEIEEKLAQPYTPEEVAS